MKRVPQRILSCGELGLANGGNLIVRAFELITSTATLKELESGEYPHQAKALELIREVAVAKIDDAISEIVETYIDRKLMPDDPDGDALHLAVASYHRCDFLLTWNCRHLANANKFAHIRRVNSMLGLFVPTLVTPLELLGKGVGHVPE